jgi:hypothetical protein
MRHNAIYNTHPNVKSIDDGLGAFDSEGNRVEIDEAKVEEEIKRLEAEYESFNWQRSRINEYPDFESCVHALLDGGDTLTELQAKRAEVKAKYPKPT